MIERSYTVTGMIYPKNPPKALVVFDGIDGTHREVEVLSEKTAAVRGEYPVDVEYIVHDYGTEYEEVEVLDIYYRPDLKVKNGVK